MIVCTTHACRFQNRCASPKRLTVLGLITFVILAVGTFAAPSSAIADPRPSETWSPPAGLNPTTVIDLLVEQGWQDRSVVPADRCSDEVFVRRIYLDLAGRIPTPQEAAEFLAETGSDKRARLAARLVESDDFARHASELIDAVLLGRVTRARAYRRRQNDGWFDYLERSFRNNRPWDQMVRDILLARPRDEQQAGAQWFLFERGDEYQEIAEAIAPGFFGVQIQCAQCHDHPLAPEIEQRHYWGLVAFFNRGRRVDGGDGPRVAESATGGFLKFSDLAGISSDAELTFLGTDRVVPEERPQEDQANEEKDDQEKENDAPDPEEYMTHDEQGNELRPPVPRFSRRQQFVDVIVDENPLIARAFVNRVWTWLMGRGIQHPVDRMDSDTPASHPELLDWLAKDFQEHQYDVRRLILHIVASRPYQLESRRTTDAVGDEAFAWSIVRPLTAEAYYRSLLQVVGDASFEPSIDDMLAFQDTFPDVFAETSMTTLSQSLFMSNNRVLQSLVEKGAEQRWNLDTGQPLTTVRARAFVDSLWQAAYCRAPDDEEREQVVAYLTSRSDRPNDAVSQVLWAVATSGEFRFNH